MTCGKTKLDKEYEEGQHIEQRASFVKSLLDILGEHLVLKTTPTLRMFLFVPVDLFCMTLVCPHTFVFVFLRNLPYRPLLSPFIGRGQVSASRKPFFASRLVSDLKPSLFWSDSAAVVHCSGVVACCRTKQPHIPRFPETRSTVSRRQHVARWTVSFTRGRTCPSAVHATRSFPRKPVNTCVVPCVDHQNCKEKCTPVAALNAVAHFGSHVSPQCCYRHYSLSKTKV